MPKFNWARANEGRGSREFRVTPEITEQWFGNDRVDVRSVVKIEENPNDDKRWVARWEGDNYPLPQEWSLREKVAYIDLVPSEEGSKPSARCQGCHSSEFDATGKCVYCRQYRSA